MLNKLYLLLLIIGINSQAFDYKNSGKDWKMGDCLKKRQSPINLQAKNQICDSGLFFELTLINIGNNVIIEKSSLGITSKGLFAYLYATDLNGELFEYESESFIIKTPSEHFIDDKQYPLELQIKFKFKSNVKNFSEQKAIISILFALNDNINVENPFFKIYNPSFTSATVLFINLLYLFSKRDNFLLNIP